MDHISGKLETDQDEYLVIVSRFRLIGYTGILFYFGIYFVNTVLLSLEDPFIVRLLVSILLTGLNSLSYVNKDFYKENISDFLMIAAILIIFHYSYLITINNYQIYGIINYFTVIAIFQLLTIAILHELKYRILFIGIMFTSSLGLAYSSPENVGLVIFILIVMISIIFWLANGYNLSLRNNLLKELTFKDMMLNYAPATYWVIQPNGKVIDFKGRNELSITGPILEKKKQNIFQIMENYPIIRENVKLTINDQTDRQTIVFDELSRKYFMILTKWHPYENQLLMLMIDITTIMARRNVFEKQQSIQSDEYKYSNIENLSATIAHEFNNIHTIIKGYVEILEQNITDHEITKTALHKITGEIARATLLTNQMLTFTNQDLEMKEFVTASILVTNLEILVKMLISTHDIDCSIQFTNGKDYLYDNNLISELFINIVSNAIDAIEDSGSITVMLEVASANSLLREFPQDLEKDQYLSITIDDTGNGMSQEEIVRAFEPFYSTKTKGLGLGIPTISLILNRIGGLILIQSEKSRGTTVKMIIPIGEHLKAKSS